MSAGYVLSLAAEADLRSIIRYTREQWGDAQTRSYVARLQAGMEKLAAGRGVFRTMTALHPGLRMLHCEHHYIFSLQRGDAPALVVAILHERMDLMMRVADRLK
ncbi:MAG TPA: type II toxin-antitoxin system RelE/ParE family toxin [Sphingopyxis sp.]|nr:type II toxin-antitoxin system RelE/ParE family toxin [Sphingopyxis sp.]HMP45628.1 type II toxin-antitoxin system RelE/ParE family toxin [Sphingopyxis sp.]HMQ20162.1 type II toxin-antitoxin system RelE/ParE family toxin [Sphingopyxis sp.]